MLFLRGNVFCNSSPGEECSLDGRDVMAKTIQAPLPGTFYRASAPGEPPFKLEGDMVAVGDTVGLIEVMKSFTPVVAEEAGTLIAFHVENEDAVMAGQPLYDLA